MRVSPWLIAGTTIGVSSFFLVAMRAVMRSRGTPVSTGIEGLIGRRGVALSALSPQSSGQVRVESEVWSAVSDSELVAPGEEVTIVAVEGVTLRVRCMVTVETRDGLAKES